jgi:hypothetical protein
MGKKFEDILNRDYRWPKPGDRVIGRAGQGAHQYVAQDGFERHSLMGDGYFRAGEVLIDQCHRDPFDAHMLIYPILFCYRHALEISLKWIVQQYGRLGSVALPEKSTHDLAELWKLHCEISKVCGNAIDREPEDAVGRIVQDFHEMDKGSFTFRYATDKNGVTITLPRGIVDLATLRDVMESCANFFQGSDGYYSDLLTSAPPMRGSCLRLTWTKNIFSCFSTPSRFDFWPSSRNRFTHIEPAVL